MDTLRSRFVFHGSPARAVWLALLLAAAAFVSPRRVHAATLVSSNPGDKDTLSREPVSVVLQFDRRIVGRPGSYLQVMLGDQDATLGLPRVDHEDGTTFSVLLRPGMGAGTYTVAWKVIDFGDGSVMTGVRTFGVGGMLVAPRSPRTGQIAHGPLASNAPSFAFVATGSDATGDGQVEMDHAGAEWSPFIFLEGVQPLQAYTVQFCTLNVDGSPTCSTVDATTTVLSSDRGVILAFVSLVFPGEVDLVTVSNPNNGNDGYAAGVGGGVQPSDAFGDPDAQAAQASRIGILDANGNPCDVTCQVNGGNPPSPGGSDQTGASILPPLALGQPSR